MEGDRWFEKGDEEVSPGWIPSHSLANVFAWKGETYTPMQGVSLSMDSSSLHMTRKSPERGTLPAQDGSAIPGETCGAEM